MRGMHVYFHKLSNWLVVIFTPGMQQRGKREDELDQLHRLRVDSWQGTEFSIAPRLRTDSWPATRGWVG